MSSGWKKYLLAFYYISTNKFSLTLAGFGLLLVALGYALDPFGPPSDATYAGVDALNAMSGILGVIGASFFVFGIIIYVVLLTSRKLGEWANE